MHHISKQHQFVQLFTSQFNTIMKASNNVNGGGGSSSNNFSILHQNPNFTSPLKAILPDVSSVSSYQLDVDQIIIKREESQNIRRPNKSSPPSSPPVVDDSELSIFDARNYFNDSIVNNNSSTTQQQQKKKILNIHQHHHIPAVFTPASQLSASLVADGFRRRSGSLQSYATPTASSEASWNSHTGLLTNRPDGALSISESSLRSSSRLELDPAAIKNKGGPGPAAARWFLFRRKICPCSGKKSVQVKKIKPTSFLATTPISYSSRPKNEVLIPAAAPHTTIIRMQEEEESVVVDDSDKTVANSNYNCTRISVGGGGGGGGFTFPNLLNPPTNSYTSPMIKNVLINTRAAAIHHLPHDMMLSERVPFAAQEDPPRDSLEVFQPSGGGDGRRGLLIMNSVVKASAASRPRPRDDDDGRLVLSAFVPPAASSPPRPVDTDDMGSDASSDLFEIESLSTTDQSSSYPIMTASTYRPHPAAAAAALLTGRHRDSLDEARPRFSTANNSNNNNNYYDDQYEPSEASVAWTVTTAAYDQASMAGCSVSASDVEEFTRLQVRLHHHLLSADQNNTTTINDQGGRRQIRSDPSSGTSGGGILMSCRCEKAVSVGPDPVKFHAPLRSSGGGGGSTFRHVSGRVEGGRDSKPPLTTSHGARLSLAFAT